MKLYAPSRPNRSTPLGTAIFRSKPTDAEAFCANGAGSVTFSAVQPTVRAPAVPPVTLVTEIGVLDGQLPCALSHRRRYTSASGVAAALVNVTLSWPAQLAPVALLVRLTVYASDTGVRVASAAPVEA